MRVDLLPARACVLLLLAGGLTGCRFTHPAPVKQSFLLHLGEARASTPRHPVPLEVGYFRVAAPFEGKGLVFRTGELRYESDFYHEFFVTPAAMVTERVTEWLARARPFDPVLAPGTGLKAPCRLEGLVRELYGDVRDESHPAAVLAIHFYLLCAEAGSERLAYERLLRREVGLADGSSASLARGLSTALEQVLTELEGDLRALPPLGARAGAAPKRRGAPPRGENRGAPLFLADW